MTELAAPQISSLMEALPGIAAVLRSPVANAMVAVSRSAVGLETFQIDHAEELLRFGVRRNLLAQEEVDKVLEELRDALAGRPPKPQPPPPEKPKKVPGTPAPLRITGGARRPTPPPRPAPKPVSKPLSKPASKPAAAPAARAAVAPKPPKSKVVAKPKAAPKRRPPTRAHKAAKPAAKRVSPAPKSRKTTKRR